MREFRETGRMTVADAVWHRARVYSMPLAWMIRQPWRKFAGCMTRAVIWLIRTPQSASLRLAPFAGAWRAGGGDGHGAPGEFPDAIEQAIGIRPELPPRLAGLMARRTLRGIAK